MDVFNFDLPPTVMEMTIQGGQSVMFGPGVFNSMTDLRRIRVSHSKIVVFRSFAAVDVSVLTLYLDIEQCQILLFERNSFHNLRGKQHAGELAMTVLFQFNADILLYNYYKIILYETI